VKLALRQERAEPFWTRCLPPILHEEWLFFFLSSTFRIDFARKERGPGPVVRFYSLRLVCVFERPCLRPLLLLHFLRACLRRLVALQDQELLHTSYIQIGFVIALYCSTPPELGRYLHEHEHAGEPLAYQVLVIRYAEPGYEDVLQDACY
jgi:hypothetical protein